MPAHDLSERYFRRFVRPQGAGHVVDMGRLAESLLLYRTVIIDSSRLLEIPEIIPLFGYDGTRTLIEDGTVKIHCDAIAIGESRRADGFTGPVLPLGTYRLVAVRVQNIKKSVSGWL